MIFLKFHILNFKLEIFMPINRNDPRFSGHTPQETKANNRISNGIFLPPTNNKKPDNMCDKDFDTMLGEQTPSGWRSENKFLENFIIGNC